MRYGSIYLLTNRHTKEQYVGQTIKSVDQRWYAHCVSAKTPKFPIAHNIALHGKDAFDVKEVFVAFSKPALNWAEQTLISELQPVLNKTKGGAGSPRSKTPEECARLSEAAKRRWENPEWRARTVASLKSAVRPTVPYEVLRDRGKAVCAKRWANHVKKPRIANGTDARTAQRADITARTWQNPEVRDRRIVNIRNANQRSEVKAKKALASTGRVMSRDTIEKIARAKWKPIYCPELQVTFLSQKHAAEFLGVLKTSVCNAVKMKGKVSKQFTLLMVA